LTGSVSITISACAAARRGLRFDKLYGLRWIDRQPTAKSTNTTPTGKALLLGITLSCL
jgi:hypothetical protein